MVELVKAPWVKAVATPVIDVEAISDFIDEHGLVELSDDDHSPIGRMMRQMDGMIRPPASADLAEDHPLSFYSDIDMLEEFAGRFCYRAWGKGRSTEDYLGNIIAERHGSVLAHANVSFIITGVSRSLTHELIRHHVGTNPSQESQRYVTADGGELEIVGYRATRAVVPPLLLNKAQSLIATDDYPSIRAEGHAMLAEFREDFLRSLDAYNKWQRRMKAWDAGDGTLAKKRANEAARSLLPNATETRLVWTMNMRAARNIIEQRGNMHADLEIRRLAVALARELKAIAPITFADTEIFTASDGLEAVSNVHVKV